MLLSLPAIPIRSYLTTGKAQWDKVFNAAE